MRGMLRMRCVVRVACARVAYVAYVCEIKEFVQDEIKNNYNFF